MNLTQIEIVKRLEKMSKSKWSSFKEEAKVEKQLSHAAIGAFKKKFGAKPNDYLRLAFVSGGLTIVLNQADNEFLLEHMDNCVDVIGQWKSQDELDKELSAVLSSF